MKGYKVIADEKHQSGQIRFQDPPRIRKAALLSSEDPILVREWMKALMKSTIGRDHSFR